MVIKDLEQKKKEEEEEEGEEEDDEGSDCATIRNKRRSRSALHSLRCKSRCFRRSESSSKAVGG